MRPGHPGSLTPVVVLLSSGALAHAECSDAIRAEAAAFADGLLALTNGGDVHAVNDFLDRK